MKRILILSTASVILTGCATNMVSKFYVDRSSQTAARCLPYSGSTQIYSTSDPQRDTSSMLQNGYQIIGESSFWCVDCPITKPMLDEQAKKVGADTVLYFTKYEGSEQGYATVPVYHPGTTSYTTSSGNMTANVFGSGGSAFGSGSYMGTSTTTTPGTFTSQIVPVTRQRFTDWVSFWRKGKPPVLGVYVNNLTPELRQKFQRNTGAIVLVVINDSPAFRANILPGDILTKIDATEISSGQDFLAKLPGMAGKKVDVIVLRNDTTLTIPIQLNEAN